MYTFGMMGCPPDLVVGSRWIKKNNQIECIISESELKSDGMTRIYHLVRSDRPNDNDFGWYTWEHTLQYFEPWKDPYAKVKEICKREGWEWYDNL